MAYRPLIKEKGFCPNPVVRYGIPAYADALSNPAVKNTEAYRQYWEEQIYYCINGYNTGGVFIPGRYYFYLNFIFISTVGRGNHFADYVDADLEFFNLVEYCKKHKKGLITLKARRRGMSEKIKGGIFGHGVRFTPSKYKGAVVAGLSTHSELLFNKFLETNNVICPEFYVHSKKDKENWIAKYQEERSKGTYVDGGSFNEMICRTAMTNPAIVKGHYFDDLALEEAGEFKHLLEVFGGAKDAMMDAGQMVGTMYIFGTGGDITGQSSGFMHLWHNAEANQLMKFELYGPRLRKPCYIGARDREGMINHDCPNILNNPEYKDLSTEQLLGCEDTERARQLNMEKRAELQDSANLKPFYDEIQNNPNDEKEAFLRFNNNEFNKLILTSNLQRIASMNHTPYTRYKLEWKRDEKMQMVYPLEVVMTALMADEKADFELKIAKGFKPEPNIPNLDIAGIDSYDQDLAQTSKSLGAMVILRTGTVGEPFINKVIASVRCRPTRKEKFYEGCLMASILFNLRSNVLIDYGKPMIIDYFMQNGGLHLLSPRPKSIESPNSEQSHEFGVLITPHKSKPLMLSLLQTYVVDHGDTIDFEEVNGDLLDYDVEQKVSDWDSADALGIALIRLKDMYSNGIRASRATDPFAKAYELAGKTGGYGVSLEGRKAEEYTDPALRELVKRGLW